jgi:ankyrin repeat protein
MSEEGCSFPSKDARRLFTRLNRHHLMCNTEGWSLTVQGRGFKSCSIVVCKVFGVRRANCSSIRVLILVFETLSIFVFHSVYTLMS